MYIYADAIRGIAIAYLLFVLGLVAFALYKPKKWSMKALAAALVLLVFIGPFAYRSYDRHVRSQEARERYEVANALFRERCKTSGEKIQRTEKDVEGIFLMKIRPDRLNYGQQFEMDDPYGADLRGDAYIRSFLRDRQTPRSESPHGYGYAFVEAVDPTDGIRYRYTGVTKVVGRKDSNAQNVKVELERDPQYDLNVYRFVLEKAPATGPQPRYGITYDDISTLEDRKHWIAGSSLRIVDLETGEVIAERTGYMMDPAQGSRARGRSPWLLAADNACPAFSARFPIGTAPHGSMAQLRQSYDFAESVLKPRMD